MFKNNKITDMYLEISKLSFASLYKEVSDKQRLWRKEPPQW